MTCNHVYSDIKKEICPDCNKYTHETDWSFQHELHRKWIAEGKAEKQGWTSI